MLGLTDQLVIQRNGCTHEKPLYAEYSIILMLITVPYEIVDARNLALLLIGNSNPFRTGNFLPSRSVVEAMHSYNPYAHVRLLEALA